MSMMQEAINRSGMSAQEFAESVNYSKDAVYKAMQGRRRIPSDAKGHLAQLNIMGGLAVAHEATGYCIFSITNKDRHPQNLIRRLEKEDREADEALKDIPYLIIDATAAADLSPQAKEATRKAMMEVADRIRADLDLLVEMDHRYKLGVIEYLTTKK